MLLIFISKRNYLWDYKWLILISEKIKNLDFVKKIIKNFEINKKKIKE